ncbi:MAG: hypothetical protein GY930_06775 [bacterium]|nr:hypothetical protein [bacterium]
MFDPLPDSDRDGMWSSSGVITEADVRTAIREAAERHAQTKELYEEALAQSDDSTPGDCYASHLTEAERHAAGLAHVQAVLITAMHLEGAVNAWGVIVAGQTFFKKHIERGMIETKIALLIALDGQGCIPPDHKALVSLRNLFDRRNQFAHRKTKEMAPTLDSFHLQEEDGDGDLTLCREALEAFRGLILTLSPRLAFMVGGYAETCTVPEQYPPVGTRRRILLWLGTPWYPVEVRASSQPGRYCGRSYSPICPNDPLL